MAKIKTNIQLVNSLMNFSPVGAMGQMFVVEAIRKYAEQCSCPEGQAKLREAMDGGMINPDAWIRAAEDVKKRCDEFYGSKYSE